MADTARIEELRRRVQTDPASIAFAALAEEYRRAGQCDYAIATCRTGLQRHPAYLSARVTLGRSLLEIGRYDEARHELEQVLRAAPENLGAIRALAEIHRRVGELPEPEHQFQATEAQPGADPPAPAPQEPPVTTAGGPPTGVAPAADPTPPAMAGPTMPAVPPAAAPMPPQAAIPVAPQRATPVAALPATPVAPQAVVSLSPQPGSLLAAALVVRPPAPASRQPHPDEVALSALEIFLSAIVAVRASGIRVSH